MSCIIKSVNFKKSKRLNHHQFQEFLKSTDDDYGGIVYFSEVGWLCQDKMLKGLLWFAKCNQILYRIKENIYARTWRWKLVHRSIIFGRVDCSFKWDKHVPSRWKSTYFCNVSSHNNIWSETLITASSSNSKKLYAMYLDTLAKYSPMNKEKYAVLSFVLVKEFENGF